MGYNHISELEESPALKERVGKRDKGIEINRNVSAAITQKSQKPK